MAVLPLLLLLFALVPHLLLLLLPGSSGLRCGSKGPGARPHQGNITLLWNEVISSSRCKEMGIYVTVGMVFIFSNFQITFD